MSDSPRPRRPAAQLAREEPVATGSARDPARPAPLREKRPFLLDFFPLESEKDTRLARFYENLRAGRLTTTRCRQDSSILWPPRTACPRCHAEELEWVDLPDHGRLYAFSAVLAGAPLGMEEEVPFSVGLVDLDGVALRLFGRIEGKPWNALHVGEAVRVEPYDVGDGRVFYRFRAQP